VIASQGLRLDYTTIADIIAIGVLAGLYWLYRQRRQLGAGTGYAKDPVCGMQVEAHNAPVSLRHGGTQLYFCSEHCRARFAQSPERFATRT
jgi:uncharacterized protein